MPTHASSRPYRFIRRSFVFALAVLASGHFVGPTTAQTTSPDTGWNINDTLYPRSRAVRASELGVRPDAPDLDQTAALNAALQRVADDPNLDTLHLSAGTYLIAGQLSLRPGVNLIGDGVGNTILQRRDESNYLLFNKRLDAANAVVAHLTLDNASRTVMFQMVSKLNFSHVEFSGGMVRLEGCADIRFTHNVFNENLGKAAYASNDCDRITLTHNRFNGIVDGSINLSGHRDCYVAFNHITAAKPIQSGYAGIRLPNGATNNVVENNLIENHGRGLFVLSSSTGNTLRGNVVRNITAQAIFVQASNNRIEGNVIIDAGDEAIYVIDATAADSPTPSLARNNRIVGNTIYDTHPPEGNAPANDPRHVALRIAAGNNLVEANTINTTHGRVAMQIAPSNRASRNVTWKD